MKGTLVLTNKGLVKIESISVGDSVYSYNEKNNEVEIEPVQEVSSLFVNKLKKLEIDNQYVYITADHPVFVINKKWIES